MKTADCKMQMAYALGKVACDEKNDHTKVKLEPLNGDWKSYYITGHNSLKDLNNAYSLWYEGNFGREKGPTRLMMIEEGWNLNHAIVLLIAAIDMHKAEVKKNK